LGDFTCANSSWSQRWFWHRRRLRPVRSETETPKVEKPKRKRMSTEARVIYELHRHGIYW
jgi:hypothetical protein